MNESLYSHLIHYIYNDGFTKNSNNNNKQIKYNIISCAIFKFKI